MDFQPKCVLFYHLTFVAFVCYYTLPSEANRIALCLFSLLADVPLSSPDETSPLISAVYCSCG